MTNRSSHHSDAQKKLYKNQKRNINTSKLSHRVALHLLVGLACFGLFMGFFDQIEHYIGIKFGLYEPDKPSITLYQIPRTVNLRQKHGDSVYDIAGKNLKKNTDGIRINRKNKRDSSYFIKVAKIDQEKAIQLATRRAKQIAELDRQAALNEALAKAALLEAEKRKASSSEIMAKKIAGFELNSNKNTGLLTGQPDDKDLLVASLTRSKILTGDEIEQLKQDKLNRAATFVTEQVAPMPNIHSGAVKSEFVENMLAQVTAQAHETELGWSGGNGKSSTIRRQTISMDKLNGFTVLDGKLATKESENTSDRILMANIQVPAPLKRPKYSPKSKVISTSRSSLTCLTTALYHEVRGESRAGQLAVAEVISARRRSRSYPNTFCGVIYQNATKRNRCQFSFACDGKTDLPRDLKTWAKMKKLAGDFLAGRASAPKVRGATHYHTTKVSPKWRWSMKRIGRIGAHIFYKDPRAKA
ncbi:MAG: cell wall hydrolase [OCS116 cluster bacterium]|uniref:Cell wall hydrolase SleB domain-containing protein n=1 Tax=OCS116 cluster bacterium TaxID=2030921 RepID=A0A2A4Z8W2_9PROT|nr:cell wall hydrolase [OCS116 cluster bacterium]